MTQSTRADHLSKLVLLAKFSTQYTEIIDKILAGAEQCFFGSNLAVGLYSKFERWE